MMKIPSRGWGPWRQEFYSIHSNPDAIKADVACEHGLWSNVWIGRVSNFVYDRWPTFWRWFMNLPPLHRRNTRRLNKFFPNLR